MTKGKRKPKKKRMARGGDGLVAKDKGKRSKKEQGGNPNPMTKFCSKVFVHALLHVPKMQFPPAIDDGFMLYPVLCEQLNNEDSVKQVALVMLYPDSTSVVDAVTVCNAEWKHRSTLWAGIPQDGCNHALVRVCHVQVLGCHLIQVSF